MTHKQPRLNTLLKIDTYLRNDLPRFSAQSKRTPQQVLDYTKRLLAKVGNPEQKLQVIHVSGTTGKGSVSYMIDAILRAHNKKSTLIVSPHVYDPRERLQINGQLAPEKLYIQLVNTVLAAAHTLEGEYALPSYFGIITTISLLGASIHPVDYVVIEAGLGGEFELTNLVNPHHKYCVITPIMQDQSSGPSVTLEQIASQRTQVITPGSVVASITQHESVESVIINTTQRSSSPVTWVKSTRNYQVDNELLALNATKLVATTDGWQFNEVIARTAAERIYIPGRYERRGINDKLVLLDGAHSPENLSGLVHRLETEGHTDLTVVFALGQDKDTEHCLRALHPITKKLIITEYFRKNSFTKTPSIEATEIAAVARSLHFTDISIEPNSQKAVRNAAKQPGDILITGSFYLLSEVDGVF